MSTEIIVAVASIQVKWWAVCTHEGSTFNLQSCQVLKILQSSREFSTHLQVGAQSLNLGVKGAYYNVQINLKQIKDEAYTAEISGQVEGILKESEENCGKVMDTLASRDK